MSGATRYEGPETLPRAARCSSCGTSLRASAHGLTGLCRVCAAMPEDVRRRHAERQAAEVRAADEQRARETRRAAEVAALAAAGPAPVLPEKDREVTVGLGQPSTRTRKGGPATDWGAVAERVAAAVRSGGNLRQAAREVGITESALGNALTLSASVAATSAWRSARST